MSQMKIIFAGTPDFSVPPLKSLIESGHEVVAVYTQPDRPAGRGRKLTPSPVKQVALDNNVPVFQPLNFKEADDQQKLIDLNTDLMVVITYGLILPKVILDAPRLGCINIHASLLPRWRGAAPIQRSILAGDKETGITIMQMDVGLDTGDMLLKKACAIGESDTGSILHDKLSVLGAESLMDVLPLIESDNLQPEKQNDADANYAEKLQKSEALIDWNQSAEDLVRKVNAFNSWPVAQTQVVIKNKTQMLRIWEASLLQQTSSEIPGKVIKCDADGIDVATGDAVLRLSKVQLPGGKPTSVKDFTNAHDLTGYVLGHVE